MNLRYLSVQQMSDMSGKDRRTIKKRLSHLKVHSVEGRAQLYDMYEALDAISDCVTMNGEDISKQMKLEGLRHEKAKADKVEMEVGKLRQELVSIEQVATVVERQYGAVRAGMLSLPSKLAGDFAVMDNFNAIKNQMEDSINEVLTELTADKAYAEKHPPQLDNTEDNEVSHNVSSIGSPPHQEP